MLITKNTELHTKLLPLLSNQNYMYINLYVCNYRDKNIYTELSFLLIGENVERQTFFQLKMLLGICVS